MSVDYYGFTVTKICGTPSRGPFQSFIRHVFTVAHSTGPCTVLVENEEGDEDGPIPEVLGPLSWPRDQLRKSHCFGQEEWVTGSWTSHQNHQMWDICSCDSPSFFFTGMTLQDLGIHLLQSWSFPVAILWITRGIQRIYCWWCPSCNLVYNPHELVRYIYLYLLWDP